MPYQQLCALKIPGLHCNIQRRKSLRIPHVNGSGFFDENLGAICKTLGYGFVEREDAFYGQGVQVRLSYLDQLEELWKFLSFEACVVKKNLWA